MPDVVIGLGQPLRFNTSSDNFEVWIRRPNSGASEQLALSDDQNVPTDLPGVYGLLVEDLQGRAVDVALTNGVPSPKRNGGTVWVHISYQVN